MEFFELMELRGVFAYYPRLLISIKVELMELVILRWVFAHYSLICWNCVNSAQISSPRMEFLEFFELCWFWPFPEATPFGTTSQTPMQSCNATITKNIVIPLIPLIQFFGTKSAAPIIIPYTRWSFWNLWIYLHFPVP